jgi:hypothetical protein
MTASKQAIIALLAYDEALHGKTGTLGERVVAMTAAIEAAEEAKPAPDVPAWRPRHDWGPRA